MILIPLLFPSLVSGQINYYLHTRQSSPQRLEDFDGSKPTKFIIHGYLQTGKDLWYTQMKDEYLKKGDFNIIQVDWASLAFGNYVAVAYNTQMIGERIGQFIADLHEKYNLPISDVHLIGHSLGSHISAYASRKIFQSLNAKVKRISALDAAGPLFEKLPIFKGIKKNDAEIIDAIHTDGGLFGSYKAVGTVDFYPNGGVKYQPGCSILMLLAHTKEYTPSDIVFCSHRRSYYYFIDSINKRVFEGRQCDSWNDYLKGNCSDVTAIMGDGYVNDASSIGKRFYLSTEN